jgi:hypothetical protein
MRVAIVLLREAHRVFCLERVVLNVSGHTFEGSPAEPWIAAFSRLKDSEPFEYDDIDMLVDHDIDTVVLVMNGTT